MQKIEEAKQQLLSHQIDGWLLYEFHGANPLALQFLEIPQEHLLTRRAFYWIPQEGDPVKIVHQIEAQNMDHLPGEKKVYRNWQELHRHLKGLLRNQKRIAMEYSPFQQIPTVSKIDGGLLDLIRSFGPEVVSSAPFLQQFTCVWTPHQYQLHKEAAAVLEKCVELSWKYLEEGLERGEKVTEYDIQQLILDEFEKEGCVTEGAPICGVNANSADPHYIPTKDHSQTIQKGDIVLIDLWCKKNVADAVFADITRMGVAGVEPSDRQQEIFSIVRLAQKVGTDWIIQQHEKGEEIKGYEVDQKVRQVIEEAGYGKYFTHRTGHNIHQENHGPGANLDSIETQDDRPLIPNTCFSVEPGIYIPGELGVRLEYDIFMHADERAEVTVPPQEAFLLFS